MAVWVLGAALLLGGPLAEAQDISGISEAAAKAAVARFQDQDVQLEQIRIAVATWDKSGIVLQDGYRSSDEVYPASVVKLFYLAYLGHQLDAKKLRMTDEIERASRDMIVDSDNDATNWLVEVLTGAASGPELTPRDLKAWMHKRQSVNRHFHARGYTEVNACQKTWYSGPYGRERQGYGKDWELRNSLSPRSCVRLMVEIMTDDAASAERCSWMRGYLRREIPADSEKADAQSRGYSGKILPKGTKLWSKAGWTDTVRHDVAAVETAEGKRYAWAIFTKERSNVTELVPYIASEIFRRLEEIH